MLEELGLAPYGMGKALNERDVSVLKAEHPGTEKQPFCGVRRGRGSQKTIWNRE